MKIENMFIEGQSKFDFTETVETLETLIKEGGWGLKHTHDLAQMLIDKDFDVLPAKALEICKPALANEVLAHDATRMYSNMMPCRLSVYEKEDGKTYVSRMNIEVLGSMIGGDVAEVMGGAFHEVEKMINEVVVS